MSHRTKKDPNQIVQFEHNEELNAKRVEIVSADMSIELDADDGDSVQTQGRLFEYSNMQNDVAVPCGACSDIKMYMKSLQNNPTASPQLMVSPSTSGDDWELIQEGVPSTTNGVTKSEPKRAILAQRMKVTGLDSSVEVKILGRG